MIELALSSDEDDDDDEEEDDKAIKYAPSDLIALMQNTKVCDINIGCGNIVCINIGCIDIDCANINCANIDCIGCGEARWW